MRVSDRDRSAPADLILKDRNDRSGRSEDVAEAYDRQDRAIVPHAMRDILNDQLRQSFGYSHDTTWTHGLIRRNQDETFNTRLHGSRGQNMRSERIVRQAGERVSLDEGDMFIGGGVQHDIDRLLCENLCNQHPIGDGAQDRDQFDLGSGCGLKQCPVHVKQRDLAEVEKDQPARPEMDQLPTELGADGSACARHQHRLSDISVETVKTVERILSGLCASKEHVCGRHLVHGIGCWPSARKLP